ncbi:MAG: hypothetical protein HGA65_08640 [Oscillochloris sp.]|nr:hypothetical protein [Oscillochloris sp.]
MATMLHNIAPPTDEGWREFGLDDLPAPQQEAASTSAIEAPSPATEQPPRRKRGRPRRADRQPVVRPAVVTPVVGSRPEISDPRPAPILQAAPTGEQSAAPEDEEALLRRLWQQLHPHGRRAVLSYIAEQLVLQPET